LVTADRGYWDSSIEADLALASVGTVVIPRTGKPSAARAPVEHADDFVDAVNWRTGCEGRAPISNATGHGDAPGCAATPAPAPGADTACSPTTSSNASS